MLKVNNKNTRKTPLASLAVALSEYIFGHLIKLLTTEKNAYLNITNITLNYYLTERINIWNMAIHKRLHWLFY